MILYDLVIASDHAGFELKSQIIEIFKDEKIKIKNLGTDSTNSVDYPDFSKKLTEEIVLGNANFGILICNTGVGMSIAANRTSEIRAALCFNVDMVEKARLHNDANILVLGSSIIEIETAIQMIDKFLNTKFEGGRHSRRIAKIG